MLLGYKTGFVRPGHNCHIYGSGERNGKKKRRTKVSYDRSTMRTLELQRLAKGPSRDETMLNSEKIKPIALVIIELRLSEGISQIVSQSVEKSVK